MNVPAWVWIATVGGACAIVVADLFILGRRPHKPSNRETGTALGIFVGLAILFGLGVWYFSGPEYAVQYFSGWLTEYSLSIDNLFIFLILMAKFAVPEKYQQAALMAGIVIALVLRGIFIAVGAVALEQFSWLFYLFGAFLIYTAIKLMAEQNDHDGEEYEESGFLKWVEKHLPFTSSWDHGTKMLSREAGKKVWTPFALVVLALGSTDLMFALDSIPAIFGLTQEPYLVLMANIFALMGLRQLYFLIGGLLKKLVYLGTGLSILLIFIGVKLILHAMHVNELTFVNGGQPIGWAPEIPPLASLAVIIVILAVTAIASLIKSRADGGSAKPTY